MNILIACEYSGRARDACIQRGHNAISCDILPTERPGPHLQGGVQLFLNLPWDMIIGFPPCTYLSRAGAQYWPQRQREQKAAAEFAQLLYQSAQLVAIENPIGRLNQLWRYPDQTIQPWWFGEPYTKATCLWLKNLPLLTATNPIAPQRAERRTNADGSLRDRTEGKWYGDNSKLDYTTSQSSRSRNRSRTWAGIAHAMADQWLPDLSQKLSTGEELSTA